MKSPLETNRVIDAVRATLADLLVMELDDVTADSRLVEDLDADSLDLVDLNFRLGKRFGCSLPKASVLDHAANLAGEPSPFLEHGRLTPLGKALLEQGLNGYAPEQLRVGMRPDEVFAATTVRNWANQILRIFEQLPAHCPDCGHTEASVDGAGLVVCGSCHARLPVPDGDTASRQRIQAFLELSARRSA